MRNHRRCVGGFTLVEMALVLLVLGLLTRAAVLPLAALQEHRDRRATEIRLQEIRQALFAHVVAYGALPCPVTTSVERLNTAVVEVSRDADQALRIDRPRCQLEAGGVPGLALGLSGALGHNGAVLDPWGRAYKYAVSLSSHAHTGDLASADWTTPGEAARVGVRNLSADLTLCRHTSGQGCLARDVRVDQITFVVLSLGKDASTQGHQAENQDNDQYFLLQPESSVHSSQFDDQLVWGTAADTMYWMLRMGWLP